MIWMETTSDVPLVLVAVEAEGFVSNRIAAVLQNQATGLNMSNDTPPPTPSHPPRKRSSPGERSYRELSESGLRSDPCQAQSGVYTLHILLQKVWGKAVSAKIIGNEVLLVVTELTVNLSVIIRQDWRIFQADLANLACEASRVELSSVNLDNTPLQETPTSLALAQHFLRVLRQSLFSPRLFSVKCTL